MRENWRLGGWWREGGEAAGARGEDLVERLDALEEAKDAKGPKVADERELRRHKGAADGLCHADAADGDDEEVEAVPAAVVAPEGKGEPVEVGQ